MKIINVSIIVALIVLGFVTCRTNKIKIREYRPVSDHFSLITYQNKSLFGATNYKVVVSSLDTPEKFYTTYDQHSIFFEIKDYSRIEVKNDTIIFYSEYTPQVFIKDNRGFIFRFIDTVK